MNPVIDADGTQKWYLNDVLHREDGPASMYATGTQHWYLNGMLHRKDGPAVIYASGRQSWWLKDKQYFTAKAFQEAAKLTDNEMTFLILRYGWME